MRQYLALALAAVAVAAPTPAANSHKISVSRRSLQLADGSLNELALMRTLQRTLLKYNLPGLDNLDAFQKRDGARVDLTDQTSQDGEDELYYGEGTVAKTTFTLDFDTGSADLFVPGPECGQSQGCVNDAKYDNSGQDQNRQTSVTYGSGQVSGEDYKDTVTVGGLTAQSQGFISLTDASGFETSTADGLMGMGFSTIANTGYKTFFENLISQNSVDANEFSFYLGRAQSGTQDLSSMTLGGRDTDCYYGDVVEVPLTRQGYWEVAIDGVTVNGESAGPTTKGNAAIDTGTTIVLGPTDAISAIMAKVPGAIPVPVAGSTILLYAYPCNLDAKYVPKLTFGGKDLAINPLDFNLGTIQSSNSTLISLAGLGGLGGLGDAPQTKAAGADTGYCVAGVGAADLDPARNLYVVGDVFLKNWYSIYNYDGPSVSFAVAAGNQ